MRARVNTTISAIAATMNNTNAKADFVFMEPPVVQTKPTLRQKASKINENHSVGLLWCGPNAARNTVSYVQFNSRSHDAVIRVYDAAGC